jgi:hypothetical protein
LIHTDRSNSEPRGIVWPGTTCGIGRPEAAFPVCPGGAAAWARACCTGAAGRKPETAPFVALAEKAEREPEEIMRSTMPRIGK